MVTVKTNINFEGQTIVLKATLAYDAASDLVYCQLWQTFEPDGTPFDIHLLPSDDLIKLGNELEYLLIYNSETYYNELKEKWTEEHRI